MKTAFIIIVVIFFIFLGFLAGRLSDKSVLPMVNQPTEQASTTVSNSLFTSQTATFQGKITKVNDASLDVESENGQKSTLPLSDKFTIYKFAVNSAVASPSADLKNIDLDKPVLLMLELKNGQYQVTTISYFR